MVRSWYDSLLTAARESHGKVDSALVASKILEGCDVHAEDWDHNTALHYCAEGDNVSAMEMLLEHGANIDVVNGERVTPLYAAIRASARETALCLIGHKCKVNLKCTYDEFTPLHLAAKLGMPDIIAMLLERGARVDMLSREKLTPLMLACECGCHDAVHMLVASGAQLERRDRYGRVPFHFACLGGVRSCAVLVNDASVCLMSAYSSSASPYNRWNAGVFAACSGNIDMLKYVWHLMPKGVRMPGDMVNPLCVAAEKGHEAAVDWIVEKEGYSCISLDRMGALFAAVQGRQKSIVSAFVNRGVRLDSHDPDGYTALHYAVVFRCSEILEYLLERGAPVDSVDKNGWTPLFCSVKGKDLVCTETLVKYGADPNKKCQGMSAWDLACSSPGYADIVTALAKSKS